MQSRKRTNKKNPTRCECFWKGWNDYNCLAKIVEMVIFFNVLWLVFNLQIKFLASTSFFVSLVAKPCSEVDWETCTIFFFFKSSFILILASALCGHVVFAQGKIIHIKTVYDDDEGDSWHQRYGLILDCVWEDDLLCSNGIASKPHRFKKNKPLTKHYLILAMRNKATYIIKNWPRQLSFVHH